MKITTPNQTTYIRDSEICVAWAFDGKFYIDTFVSGESSGWQVDEPTFWRAVALIDPAAAEDRKKSSDALFQIAFEPGGKF